ncbi:MAG: hypothetical protein JXB32_15855 [Deltaproteobacteria bacterium]|nr:hypothetical protein [Deltaproteobacteria bacterium]
MNHTSQSASPRPGRWTPPHHGVFHLCDLPVYLQATVEEYEDWTHAYVLSRLSETPFTPIAERLFEGPSHLEDAKRWLVEELRAKRGLS